MNETEKVVPKYAWIEAKEGEVVTPIRRQIAKTMEVTELFTYYDALAYVMKMEKAVADKQAEIQGLEAMIKAYRDELEIVEKELSVTELEEKYNLELHEKLKREELEKAVNDLVHEDDDKEKN